MRMIRRLAWLMVISSLLTGCAAAPPLREERTETQSATEEFPVTQLVLPCTLPDGLVAEQLVSYTGEYCEDGSGEQVHSVAGLMVCNPTDRLLRFAAFALEIDGQQLYFFVHRLPPQSRCLILEYERKSCAPERLTACRELSVRWEHQEFSREQVDYVCVGPDMTVVNRDARELSRITVWYKRYDREGDYYFGGVAYGAYFHNLQPGQSQTVSPAHYDAADAHIVGIELEI